MALDAEVGVVAGMSTIDGLGQSSCSRRIIPRHGVGRGGTERHVQP